MPLAPAPAPPACVAPLAAAVARRCGGGGAGGVTCRQPATAAAAATVRNDGSDGVMAAMAATAATVATVAVRRGGERRHEGNLADARTQPNNLTPLQNFAQGSAQGQCPGGFNDGEGSTGRRADREEARAEGSKQRGNQMRSDKRRFFLRVPNRNQKRRCGGSGEFLKYGSGKPGISHVTSESHQNNNNQVKKDFLTKKNFYS